MMDLINRTSLKDRASEYCLSKNEYRRFCKIIDEEPVAYNVDKVIQQVEEEKEYSDADFTAYAEAHGIDEDGDFFFAGLKRAISILKSGIK